jgi:tripartite-type tricarboxylate transporter receptor subunit TctC
MRRFLLLTVALLLAAPAWAQYPNRPIRIVVPFLAGSATDVVTRIIGQSVSAAMGQPVVVDNRAGADGTIAGAEVAKSAPDGYTLMMATNSPMAAGPAMRKSPPYDPVADFTPISDIGRYTFFLFVNAALPFNTFNDLIAYAKANPGKLNYGSGNTTAIVSSAQMNAIAGISMTHVPYKSEPQAVTDLVAGRVDVLWATPTTGLAFVKDGRMRALVTSLESRSSQLPEVPTIYESGMPQFTIASWAALYGPAKMPRELVQRMNKEFHDAIRRPDVAAALEKQAFTVRLSTPEQLGVRTKEQLESYRRILAAAGVQPE